jgi:hypothetical protein
MAFIPLVCCSVVDEFCGEQSSDVAGFVFEKLGLRESEVAFATAVPCDIVADLIYEGLEALVSMYKDTE